MTTGKPEVKKGLVQHILTPESRQATDFLMGAIKRRRGKSGPAVLVESNEARAARIAAEMGGKKPE